MTAAKQPITVQGTTKTATVQGSGRSTRPSESIQNMAMEGTVGVITELIFKGTRALSPLEVVKRTREGLPASVFSKMSGWLSIPQTELFDAVGLSRSTIATRMSNNQLLSPSESDKVIRLAKVFDRAADVLGTPEDGKKWLRREIRSVGGVQPITLLDTETGYELVMDTLGRIEQGIAA
jgi:putative toxin-antitoxin system antitoxin component (TIGR02293 family)